MPGVFYAFEQTGYFLADRDRSMSSWPLVLRHLRSLVATGHSIASPWLQMPGVFFAFGAAGEFGPRLGSDLGTIRYVLVGAEGADDPAALGIGTFGTCFLRVFDRSRQGVLSTHWFYDTSRLPSSPDPRSRLQMPGVFFTFLAAGQFCSRLAAQQPSSPWEIGLSRFWSALGTRSAVFHKCLVYFRLF